MKLNAPYIDIADDTNIRVAIILYTFQLNASLKNYVAFINCQILSL